MHGTNVVVKAAPYLPNTEVWDPIMSITTRDLEYMQEWGTTIVRLGVLWEATETAPGVFDMQYLEKLEELVNKFAEYGMVTMLDNHQDLLSRKLCGEGFPHFYTPTDLEDYCPWTLVA